MGRKVNLNGKEVVLETNSQQTNAKTTQTQNIAKLIKPNKQKEDKR